MLSFVSILAQVTQKAQFMRFCCLDIDVKPVKDVFIEQSVARWVASGGPPETIRRNQMAMFEYHRADSGEPNPIYEGDRMIRKGEYVEIIRHPRRSETVVTRVAIIHLGQGEVVEELE